VGSGVCVLVLVWACKVVGWEGRGEQPFVTNVDGEDTTGAIFRQLSKKVGRGLHKQYEQRGRIVQTLTCL